MVREDSFSSLRREYETRCIGPLILGRVRVIARRELSRKKTSLYSDLERPSKSWSDDQIEEVAQDFITNSLLRDGQLEYTMQLATCFAEFDALTRRQFAQFLRGRKRRTVVDNLMERAIKRVKNPPFVWLDNHAKRNKGFCCDEAAVVSAESVVFLDDGEHDVGALARRLSTELQLWDIPKERAVGTERAPRVYAPDHLEEILQLLGSSGNVRLDFLRRVFEELLTGWYPSDLPVQKETQNENKRALTGEDKAAIAKGSLSPEDEAIATSIVEGIMGELTDEHREILILKARSHSDTEIAVSLGISRPTAAKKKESAYEIVRTAVVDYPLNLRDAVIALFMTEVESLAGARND